MYYLVCLRSISVIICFVAALVLTLDILLSLGTYIISSVVIFIYLVQIALSSTAGKFDVIR
ncbi:uncharacterized protein J3R85_004474 [Psidium guajava]|nr:uncharacterized protein J3R85_004474 [Psidium guajava]